MTQPLVDILLPVFNGASTLREAVDSLRRQTIASIRIIAIDDGSTDATPEILAKLSQEDARIAVLTKPNGGIVDALNAGLQLCQAEFVARQDADDISDPTRLAIELDYLTQHPDCIGVSGTVRHIDDRGRHLESGNFSWSPDHADPHWAPSREPYLIHPFLMSRLAHLRAVGGYRYAYHSEDTDLYWRLSERGSLHNIDVPLGDYRMHAGSISGSIVNGRIMALSSQLAALSTIRRRSGRPDIRFPKKALAEYQRARTLANIYELGRRQLDSDEASHLRIALAGKLLELAAYRPYELEIDDCRFIHASRCGLSRLCPANRSEFDRRLAGASARLVRKGLLRHAAALTPSSLYVSAAARLIATLLPSSTRGFIRRSWMTGNYP